MLVRPKNAVAAVVVVVGLFRLNTCDACTVFVAGKDATSDGSTLVSHSNDGEFDTDPRLVKIPAADHDPDSVLRPVYFSPESYPRYVGTGRGGGGNSVPEYAAKHGQTDFDPIGHVPQVDHTYAYLEETYGAVNEWQVGIGESTCSAVFGAIPVGAPNGTALMSVDALTQIAMERATTAREAVQIMGDMAVRYGFYGAGQFEGTAESLAVNDPNEVWIFHVLPDPTGTSAIWAAQRVPDDAFAVVANMFVIRHVDPTDANNFAMSDTVHTVAVEYGWWDPASGRLLDFTAVYSDGEYAHKYYSGRRVWGAYHLACPSCNFADEYEDLQSDPVYPVYAKPDYRLSAADFFRFHRYTYQGTKYDLSARGNLAGGPFSTPDRWRAGRAEQRVAGNWERPIGLYRTSDAYVVQSRRESSTAAAVLWFGPASSLGTVFTPFVVNLTDIPPSYRSGHQSEFSRSSAFWAACAVHNMANMKWRYAVQDVQAYQNERETASLAMIQQAEALYAADGDFDALERAFLDNAQDVVTGLWDLSDKILFKYASGFVNAIPPERGGMSQTVGYPDWWLESVGYADGPPPPPTKPKCCHPPKPPGSTRIDGSDSDGDGDGDGPRHRNNYTSSMLDNALTGKAAMKKYLRTL